MGICFNNVLEPSQILWRKRNDDWQNMPEDSDYSKVKSNHPSWCPNHSTHIDGLELYSSQGIW